MEAKPTYEELERRVKELEAESIRNKQTEEALRENEAIFSAFLEHSPVYVFFKDRNIRSIRLSKNYEKMLGMPIHEAIGKTMDELFPSDLSRSMIADDLQVLNEGKRVTVVEELAGRIYETTKFPVFKDGAPFVLAGFTVDITERKRAEDALRESEEKYRLAFHTSPDAINLNRASDGMYMDINEGFTKITGYTREDCIGRSSLELHIWDDPKHRDRMVAAVKKDGFVENMETKFRGKDGKIIIGLMSARLLEINQESVLLTITRDITDRKRVEEEKEKLRAQLNQAQKMESVGRLAGGVAHDFNNKLGIIMGNVEMAMMDADSDGPVRQELREIMKAAQHSAVLVRQLLGFARKQTVNPKVLDLNDTVSGMLEMLRRLIGEDIDLAWLPRNDLWRVKIDPSQIDQILANLAVNARDAIPGVGKVTLETDNASLDEKYCAGQAGCVPGQYVLLAVSDDGVGMSREVLEHLFEPFFTTKEVGKGTGLGLSTIYGIVKQNEGFINVYSESGKGTTFKIYLPKFEGEGIGERDNKPQIPQTAPGGTGTVLLVEDEESILKVGTRMLESLGYTVLAANRPSEAIRLAEAHTGPIHLVLTDVVMPEMNGKELVERLRSMSPALKCLYMSGYTANVIAHHGVLEKGVKMVQKPFSLGDLAGKVRESLEEP